MRESTHRNNENAMFIAIGTLAMGLCLLVTEQTASGVVLEGPILHYSSGPNAGIHQYYFLSQQTWHDAEVEAVSLGGHLVTVNDVVEQDWLFNTFSRQPQYGHSFQGQPGDYAIHIGFTDQDIEGQWEWISGEPVTYTNWNPSSGEPNNVGNEDYAHMQDGWEYGNHWADGYADVIAQDGKYLYAIAEVVPEPATMSLLVLGSLVAARRRRK